MIDVVKVVGEPVQAAAVRLDAGDRLEMFFIQALTGVHGATGIGQGDHGGAFLERLGGGVPGHVAGAGHRHGLAAEILSLMGQHAL